MDLNITIGYSVDALGYAAEYTGQYSSVNIFSSPLSTARMFAMTTAGSEECGHLGDFLIWEEAHFQIHSQARMFTVDELEGPCRRESGINVFTADYKLHCECMGHCEKLGKSRSPPVRTLQELETLQTELAAITANIVVLPCLWLSATDKKKEGIWSDYYTGERLGDYNKPWYPGHDDKFGDNYNCLKMYTDSPADLPGESGVATAWAGVVPVSTGNSQSSSSASGACVRTQPLTISTLQSNWRDLLEMCS